MTILRPSYIYTGISYTGKMAYLYWIMTRGICVPADVQIALESRTKESHQRRGLQVDCSVTNITF